ncbi:sulfatase-like hydrolase/transferase [Paenibacillus sabuli]|uniref:sulfatase-like hydrolase/transferase n=1 Tax=Paenibacillus sabuli TaxID=2772509 RepID=UPI00295B34A1|nr:sulfatase-like hydrolase/transferase [Paenibacillus sabuli]
MRTKPANLVYIFSDEHSKEKLGCYGHPVVQTPNLDALAKRGVRFTNAYCNFPICIPSRASMTTGSYAFTQRYWDNAHPYAGEHPGWGHRLTEAGYKAVTVGKLHYKDGASPTGFPDQRLAMHVVEGIGDLYGSIRSRRQQRPRLAEAIRDAGPGESDYTRYDRAVAEQAEQFLLEEAGREEEPWVLYVGFVTPHFPLIAPEEYYNLYSHDEVILPRQYGMDERPMHPVLEEFRRYMNLDSAFDEPTVRKALAAYYGLCSFMDAQVGRVLQALKNAGLEDSTRIIYSSDHGDTTGDHGLWHKHTMYEGSIGVPLICAGPDIPSDVVLNANVSLIDLYPTIVDGAGLKLDAREQALPGTSLWPIARGEHVPRRSVFAEYHAAGSITGMFMLRGERYKYVYYVDYEPQLFDLLEDPEELHDLAGRPEYGDVLARCECELREIVDPEAVHAQCRADQHALLNKYGGAEEVLRQGEKFAFSPTPTS